MSRFIPAVYYSSRVTILVVVGFSLLNPLLFPPPPLLPLQVLPLLLPLLPLLLLDGLGAGEEGVLHGFVGDDEVEDDCRGASHAVPGAQDQDDAIAEGLVRMRQKVEVKRVKRA